MQLVPLKLLKPCESREFTLNLLKDTNVSEHPNKKPRGQIVVDLTFAPFREESGKFGGYLENGSDRASDDDVQGAGLLSVLILEADEVEGKSHNNPYVLVFFRGERKKTKVNIRFMYSFKISHCFSCVCQLNFITFFFVAYT